MTSVTPKAKTKSYFSGSLSPGWAWIPAGFLLSSTWAPQCVMDAIEGEQLLVLSSPQPAVRISPALLRRQSGTAPSAATLKMMSLI
ncbi:hypothetical protein AV530_016994 [Patagioenas fasciata monilis]|uniref:Uncharacterized protein n=1 Tax=Patagioenas fasciata monilis TaxID=372326 RepID=A0A1V4J4Z6_PATFA|nr:hypothetical protein AV530_016994 [Patagioenas fasciata monilis]